MNWYSNECFLCLDEFSIEKPRTFTCLCQHAICVSCAKMLPDKSKCTYCSASNNPMFNNLEEVLSYELKDGTFINIPSPLESILKEDITQKLMAFKYKMKKKKKKKCLSKLWCF